ncbi:DUF6801 domain-containing protein [Actinomadura sp. SCN-SB]|uniref:DUF6801 domain-containing protein n=1 Tax=Actinomadura sp. SCN-SB TaxID=3373092 RepID=UPI003753D22F
MVLLVALMPPARAEIAPQEADVTLDYGCQLAPGPRQVSIRVNATFPGAGVVGQPIQPKDVTVRVAFPPASVAELAGQGVATVGGAVDLGTTVAQNGKSSDSAWTGLAAPATPVPKTGGLTLVASGPVPPVTVTTPGDVRFTAGLLGLTLTPKKTDGSATDPATMLLACTLNPGQGGHLVTVPVSESSTPAESPTAPNAPETTSTQAGRPRGIIAGSGADNLAQTGIDVYEDLDVRASEVCGDIANWPAGVALLEASGYLAGHANATKLKSAVRVGYPVPGLLKADHPGPMTDPDSRGWIVRAIPVDGVQYNCTMVVADLRYQGRKEFPPAQGAFLGFGFMPVTATVHISQVQDEPISSLAFQPLFTPVGEPFSIVATARLSLRLSDVRVNGVPLDVGGNCRTSGHLTSPRSPYRPDRAVLFGGGPGFKVATPEFSNVAFGGAAGGMATIPQLTGCVTPSGEDVTPLLNATVAGPDNYMKIIIGPLCMAQSVPANCTNGSQGGDPLKVPHWNVSNGGTYSSSGSVTFRRSNTEIVTCDTDVSGAVPDAVGPPRGNIGTASFSFRNCTGPGGSTWQVVQRGTAGMVGTSYNADTRTVEGKITGIRLQMTGTGVPGTSGPCTAETFGSVSLSYTNPPNARMTLLTGTGGNIGNRIQASTCPNIPAPVPGTRPLPVTFGGVFDLGSSQITITSPPASEVAGP